MSVNNSLVCWPLETYGNEEQKQRFLAPLAAGEKLGAYCLSEPGAGTDAAEPAHDGRSRTATTGSLNGMKNFITNGAQRRHPDRLRADRPGAQAQGHPRLHRRDDQSPGFSVIRKEEKMGIRASDTAQLAFDNVSVPDGPGAGPAESGFKIAMSTLDGGRIGIAARRSASRRPPTRRRAPTRKQREQFGKPICEFQAIQWKIADMATRLEAARLLTYRAAWAKDQGGRYSEEAAMAKLFASEAATSSPTRRCRSSAATATSKEYPVERHFRDAKITEIYEGTSEIQRMVIASMELKK